MSASQKIITKLLERRQIEADLQGLLAADSGTALHSQALKIAAKGDLAISAIVGSLDRADARMLAALGVVATHLDRDGVTRALRQVMSEPQYSDRSRMGAMTILERFLGEPVDIELMAALSDPEGMAVSSLEEVLGEAERNPAVLVEYVQGLDQQEPDLVLAVIKALRDMGRVSVQQQERSVEPLRMMAQDVREELAGAALQALGAIRLPSAARALQTLIPIVAPELRSSAERILRKQQFAGVEVASLPPPPASWRALVGAVDGRGRQYVWFIEHAENTAHARFLSILMSDQAGAVEAVGHRQLPSLMLPPQRPLGHIHDVALPDGSGALLMLEASFDLGRRLLLEALGHNRETQIPVAALLRLLSPWLWGYGGVDSLPPRTLPEGERVHQNGLRARSMADDLLEHPAFGSWMAGGGLPQGAIQRAAQESLRHPNWDRSVWVGRLCSELFAEPAAAEMFSRRLEAMSEWLLLAGDEEAAELALTAAQEAVKKKPQEQPFLLALVQRDLELALLSLEQSARPARHAGKIT